MRRISRRITRLPRVVFSVRFSSHYALRSLMFSPVRIRVGLQTYSLLRQAACLSSNTTDAYCYVTALSSEAHPADAYYYTLPLGSPLPNSSDPSCSSCTQQIMSEFVTQGLNTSGLRETYAGAAIITNKVCGSGFVQEMEVQNNSAGERGRARWWAVVGVCALVSVGVGGAWW